MNSYAAIDYNYFYDFCLDWQMCVVSKEELTHDFKLYGWSFEEFRQMALNYKYWVTSMSCLENV